MRAYEIVKNRFIAPFEKKSLGNVGVELEFPLLNMAKAPVGKDVAVGLLDYFCENGFATEETDLGGGNAFIINADGDTLSFDNSYNNFEFAMRYGGDLCAIAHRFYRLHAMAAAYLGRHNYLLAGMGTNPFKPYIDQAHVDYPIYNFVDGFLHAFPARHAFPDFPAYLSSVQTHLDIPLDDLPFAASLFARLDFVRAALFSNSPSWDGDGTLCYRDFLWEGSAFPNTGKVDAVFGGVDDIIGSFLERKMFCRMRGGKYEAFTPVLLRDYFDGENAGDIAYFLSFRNIEITARGTLEVRSDCAQPIAEAFAPPAFSLGIAHNMRAAQAVLDSYALSEPTSVLRDAVVGGKLTLPKGLALSLVETAAQGLAKRGLGEERLLNPLYGRAEKSVCPAGLTLMRLQKGETLDSIIRDYTQC